MLELRRALPIRDEPLPRDPLPHGREHLRQADPLIPRDWGPCPPPPTDRPADFDHNGAVDFADLLTLLANWS